MARYNPPPNWPAPPRDWTPYAGWQPDPAWGPPPPGWQLWIDDVVVGHRQEAPAPPPKRQQKADARLADSPQGNARAAFEAGDVFFQVEVPMAERHYSLLDVVINRALTSKPTRSSADVLAAIESEGWTFIDAGYVFEETGQTPTTMVLSDEKEMSTRGRIVGIYTFRRREPR